MADSELPRRIAKELSSDNLEEVQKIWNERMKGGASWEQRQILLEQVAENLNQTFNESERVDSVGDCAYINYFYLLAATEDYKELLLYLDHKVPIDYEALLFKAIEIHDAETVNHLITCKPELVNIRLKRPFATKKMQDFLLSCSWCDGLKETLKSLNLSTEMEPEVSEDLPCFEDIERELKKKAKNK